MNKAPINPRKAFLSGLTLLSNTLPLDSRVSLADPLFTMDDLKGAFQWISNLRKKYSPNNDIWNLRRDWENIKEKLLAQLNEGSYVFDPLERLEFKDGSLSFWSSRDMVALKLISQALGQQMAKYIPQSCGHVKNHGGLKKAVRQTYEALPEYQYVMRSDVQAYYASICFDVLMGIIKSYVTNPILLTLVRKACQRTETFGGLFYDYHEKGIPKGSPLSPLLGAIALIPLDKAMGNIKSVFYQRYMDDWCVLTKTKSTLRKVVKLTHEIMRDLKFQLHPLKTYYSGQQTVDIRRRNEPLILRNRISRDQDFFEYQKVR